ncbi:MAG: hypothetical protein WBC51_00820 [Vicinamibacterales bacterium]
MTEQLDAVQAGLRVARALEEAGISYALGGALAYGQHGVPRATIDVDVNVFAGPELLGDVLTALRPLGIECDEAVARRQTEEQGMLQLDFAGMRLDVFVPSIEFSQDAERTRVRQAVDGQEAWFLSAEALCVFKLLFFRGKDIVDLERLIATQGDALDADYVRTKMVEMMGDEDERVETWDRLVREHRPA